MERLDYSSYEEVQNEFSWRESWDLVDGTSEKVNATEECIDRHEGTAYRIAFEDGSTETYTFEEIARHANRFANYLEDIGIKKGDTVAVMLNPSFEFVVAFFGAMKRGAVAVPCSELFGPQGLESRLEDAEVKLLVTSNTVIEKIDTSIVDHVIKKNDFITTVDGFDDTFTPTTSGKDQAWILYTSGTTGRPTPVPFHHESIVYNAPTMELVLDIQSEDSWFSTSSPGFGAGIWYGLFGPLLYGIPSGHYSGRFDPALILEAFEEFGVNTIAGAVPTALRKLVNAAQDESIDYQVEKIMYTGEPMDVSLSRDVERVLGAFPQSIYGVTEIRSQITFDYRFPDYEFRHGSIGKPLPGIDVKIVGDGGEELPHGEIGYITAKRSDQWYVTEDKGYADQDGYFYSAGRADDTIISAGYTIGPEEVEDTLRTHEAVEEAGVIGVPDDERGEIVKAFVQTSTDAAESDTLVEELQTHVKTELGKYEYPREIEFIEDVPQTPDGKVQRALLRS